MLPMGSIFFLLIVAPYKTCFSLIERFSAIQKLGFDDTDTDILRTCVRLLLIVQLNLKLYFADSYFGDFCFYLQIKIPAKYKCLTVLQ